MPKNDRQDIHGANYEKKPPQGQRNKQRTAVQRYQRLSVMVVIPRRIHLQTFHQYTDQIDDHCMWYLHPVPLM